MQGTLRVCAFIACLATLLSVHSSLQAFAPRLAQYPTVLPRHQSIQYNSLVIRLRGGEVDADSDDNISAGDDTNWDYAKFGLKSPPTAEELSLNPQYTGKKGELDYLVRDVFIGRWGWTALHRASVQGDVESLEKMIDMGGDVNAATQNGWAPLHEAASWGREKVVELLLAKGANASATTKNGWTALHFAGAIGHAQIIKILLAAGVDRDYRDNFGDFALDKALRNARVKYPNLPMGADVDSTPEQRRNIYLAAAALLAPSNVSLDSIEPSYDRFDVYAPILPGRRRAYDVDGLDSDDYVDTTAQTVDAAGNPKMEWITRNDTDFVNEEEARREDADSFNSTELANMISFMRSQETKPPPGISTDGVQDEEVADLISRWKDEEWERRINSAIIK